MLRLMQKLVTTRFQARSSTYAWRLNTAPRLATSSRTRLTSCRFSSYNRSSSIYLPVCGILSSDSSLGRTRLRSRAMSLSRSFDPLVWIDCEMTGLNPETDSILSISCFITSYDLELLELDGYHAIISTSPNILQSMDEWCINTHTASGLVAACQGPSSIPATQASEELLRYIMHHVPASRSALLAGNSVHADKMFLMKRPWTPILEHLHYRILDVSAIKEAARRWCPDNVLENAPTKQYSHTAKDDILESLEEARYYMELFKKIG